MSRIAFPNLESLTATQRQVYDEVVAGRRKRAPKPFLAWLHSPEMAGRAQRLGEFVRYETTLAPRLSELAILVVAHWWSSEYEWAIHRAEAVKGGVPERVIAAIANDEPPDFDEPDAQAVFDFAMSLCRRRAVPDTIYQRTVAAIGERGVVELVGLLGYYTLISMTLNAFEIGSS
jgi:4-carboxymuconolactone decarboxylase